MNWYYDQGGQRAGPVSDSELDGLIAAGTVTQDTLVWSEGMGNWAPLREARPSGAAAAGTVPEGWIRCTATGKYFPPSQILYLDGKPYSAEAKPGVLQGVIQGGALPPGADTERNGPPWEQRAQLGFVPAVWQTTKGVLLKPSETFERMKREGGLGTPLLYSVIVGSTAGIANLVYQMIVKGGTSSLTPRPQGLPPGLGGELSMGFLIGFAIFMPLFIAIGSFIASGVLHLSLMICGGAKQSFETTFRTHCYASGSAGLLQIVPFCGAAVSGIWGLVCTCIGLSKTHEISTGRAVCAVLLPTAVCCVIGMFFIGAFFAMAAGMRGVHH